MAKSRSSYVCQNCGAITQRWQGKCESCGEWNTIIEEAAALGVGASAVRRGAVGRAFPLEDLTGDSRPMARIVTGMGERSAIVMPASPTTPLNAPSPATSAPSRACALPPTAASNGPGSFWLTRDSGKIGM